ncbi:hypothetical protein OSB04_031619 [Centaurea solstitialis]|uniref:Zinc finger PMZ-type domain-containing protein n=1 Tax=Centaurea solstitialis TaxID=347529 RepID=A0AA38SM10_9ASTR|nr:hypothetical protein OSB04_031619 [Centaurea solstitialis]
MSSHESRVVILRGPDWRLVIRHVSRSRLSSRSQPKSGSHLNPPLSQMYQLSDDEDVSVFMHFAKMSKEPPVLYVDVYRSDEGDDAGTSNTINEEPMYVDTQSQNQHESETSYRPDFGYGLSDSYPEVVPETHQHQQEEVQEEEEEHEYERRKFAGCADDESHVLITGLSDEEDEEGVQPSILRPSVDDYFGMPHKFQPTPDFLPTHNERVLYRRSKRLSDGKVFNSKEKMILEVGLKFLEEQFEYKTLRSCTKRYYIECSREHCKWMMKAKSVGDGAMFMVSELVDVHTCSRTQLNLTTVKLTKDFRGQYGVTIPYPTAWRARWRAITLIRGIHAESFTQLPMYLSNLKRVNPGTRTAIRTDSSGRFAECFVALGRSETADEWTWFLNTLKTCIGEPSGLVFMSDRASSINAAITAIFSNAYHALCCRHLLMNVRSKAPRIKQFKTPYWKACKAYTPGVFDRMMTILQLAIPEGAQLMRDVGVERWSRAYFPAQRFNIMTSNSAESINALSRNARKLPIVGLMEYFREFQQEWYFLRRRKGDELNHELTDWAQRKIQKRIEKSYRWTTHGIGYDRWEVRDYGNNAEVDMRLRSCTCLKWQVSGLPCGYAIAVAKHLVGPPETWQSPQDPLPTVLPVDPALLRPDEMIMILRNSVIAGCSNSYDILKTQQDTVTPDLHQYQDSPH